MHAGRTIRNLDFGAGDDTSCGINDNATDGCISRLRIRRSDGAEDQKQQENNVDILQSDAPQPDAKYARSSN
jgi:hypothetical protein